MTIKIGELAFLQQKETQRQYVFRGGVSEVCPAKVCNAKIQYLPCEMAKF